LKAKWDSNNLPASFIEDIKSHFRVDDEGKVTRKYGVDFLLDALYGRVVHSFNLDGDVLFSNFSNAVQNSFKKNGLSKPDEILNIFDSECKKRLRVENEYVLLTSISLNASVLPKRRSVAECFVSFSNNIPTKYKKSRNELMLKNSSIEVSEQVGYKFVSVSVKAPDVRTAFIKAMDALDVIRALWQIGFQKNINFIAINKQYEFPSDSIVSLGQFHTMHFKSGKSSKNEFWYVSRFKKKKPVNINNFKLAESNLGESLANLRKSKFSNHTSEVLISYIGALDNSEQEFKFLALWSALEKLVKSDDSKVIIKRISFFYEDRGNTKVILDSLRKARNVNVHSGISPLNVEMKNYHLCSYLERLLCFFIHNPFKYKNTNSLLSFISSTTELSSIDEQIKNLTMVKKFIGEV